MKRRLWKIVLTCLVVCIASASLAPAEEGPKVVIIGFDGADPKLVDRYMAEGLLPNLKALRDEGTYSPLLPTNPPQTPVSWSAFATGLNPGRTEIFDFLQHEAGSYAPDFALATRERKPFGLGKWNGLAAGIGLGLIMGLIAWGMARLLKLKGLVALAAGLLVFAVTAFAGQSTFGKLMPAEMPWAKNNRQGKPFWTVAAENGMKVGVVRVPVTFPAEELPAGSSMISGLGTPDIRGRVGTPYLWTTDPKFAGGDNEFSLEIRKLPARRGKIDTIIAGPYNYPFHVYPLDAAEAGWKEEGLDASEIRERKRRMGADLEDSGYPRNIHIPLSVEISDHDVSWRQGDQEGVLKPGEWSDWVILDFPINWLVDRTQPLRGTARFKLIQLEPEVQFYMSPINFHPASHPIPFAQPPDFAEELSDQLGLFKTIGWAVDTWSYPTERLGGIELFLEDVEFTVAGFKRILDSQLERKDLDMYIQIFYFTDRAGHLMTYNLDPGHPLFDPETAPRFEAAMRDIYKQMDDLVGSVRERIREDALYLVLSDHGFSSWRRQINYNTWLQQNGYLTLTGDGTGRRDLEQLFDKDVTGVNVFSGIDWKQTKAWSMGLGAIYINLIGREPEGIVLPGGEYNQLVKEIQQGLEGLVDEEGGGVKPVYKVYHRDDIYEEYDPARTPDLRAANILNYRVSWQDTLGGLSTTVFEDNPKVWSGDHCSLEPTEVKGILFINRKLNTDDPAMIDMAPSILNELGMEPPTNLDGMIVWDPPR